MNKECDFNAFCKIILQSYQKLDKPITGDWGDEMLTMMFLSLMNYNLNEIREAVIKHLQCSPYPPKVSDIVEQIDGNAKDFSNISFGWVRKIALERNEYDKIQLPCPVAMKTIIDLGGVERLRAMSLKELNFFYNEYTEYYRSIYKYKGRFKLPQFIPGKNFKDDLKNIFDIKRCKFDFDGNKIIQNGN